MGFNWSAIKSYEDSEVALYRLLGEMMRRKATLTDLDQIRAFLLRADLPPDGWLGLGEALHRTTSGSPVGYDIWLAWLETYEDLDIDEDRLGDRWMELNQENSEASEGTDFDPNVDVLPSPEAPRKTGSELPAIVAPARASSAADLPFADDADTDSTSVDSMVSAPLMIRANTGVLGESPTELLKLVPRGPFTLRIFDQQYDDVDEYVVLTLIKRGLFLGAEVKLDGGWVSAWSHPEFTDICAKLQAEAARILARELRDDAKTGPLGAQLGEQLTDAE